MKILTFIILSLGSFAIFAQHHHPSDPESVHGMLMVGTESIYFSHLPMFHSPHDYQVILKMELDTKTKNIYLNNKKNDPDETVYTIVPERFVLPEMVNQKGSFHYSLFKGHFERGGQVLVHNAVASISEVVYFKKFVATESKPDVLEYLVFGSANEMFLAHKIVSKPDFDSIVQINPLQVDFGNFLFTTVNFLGLSNGTPLQDKKEYWGEVNGQTLKIETKNTFYTEFGDLGF